MCDEYFSLSKHLIENPNSANVQQSIVSPVPKFYDDPTVKEPEIIVLVGQVWVYVEKDKAQCKEHFFYHGHYLENPNSGCFGLFLFVHVGWEYLSKFNNKK